MAGMMYVKLYMYMYRGLTSIMILIITPHACARGKAIGLSLLSLSSAQKLPDLAL